MFENNLLGVRGKTARNKPSREDTEEYVKIPEYFLQTAQVFNPHGRCYVCQCKCVHENIINETKFSES